ncbi:hypothetical protein GCM10022251_01280 [Phytohabitans flavus]|uniref:Uncharacterized protein n=1 Tax=Phytohabitans flavus TaxID=1076124 RepID=A0A6F8Y3U6_9ACTN|nr:hypothetical protein [Phytohabitans flavus]BCB80727.1 hypothetical protein Pflav_071370 [Phytohabitans flavus]
MTAAFADDEPSIPPTDVDWDTMLSRVREIADNEDRSPGLRAWARAQMAQILAIIEAAELEQDAADVTAALVERGESMPAEQLWAELGV